MSKSLLKYTLLIGGIGLIVGFSLVPLGIITASELNSQAHEVDLVYQNMLAAIYFVLGIMMIWLSIRKDYSKWAPFIYFVIFSSYAHAGTMIFDMIRSNPLGNSFMLGTTGLIIIATLLLFTRKEWSKNL